MPQPGSRDYAATVPDRSILPRLWRLRSSKSTEIEYFDTLGGLDPALKDTFSATRGPCTVLLGPPGSGKTTALSTLKEANPECVRVLSLGSTGSEDRLRHLLEGALEELLAATTPSSEDPVLALDSLDETSLTTTQLNGFVRDVVSDLPERVRLVLACRTAAWLPGVQAALAARFGEHLAVFDLASLTSGDVASYADSAGTDGARFLHAVEEAKALPLALNPNTLRLLLDAYLAAPGNALPVTQASLFESAVRRLLEEPNEERRSASQAQHMSPLIACAGRLAVLGLFTGRNTYRLLGEAAHNELDIDDLHAWLGGPPAGWSESVMTVLQSALFDAAGEMAVRFRHQTLAEYLAARHLVALNMSIDHANGLLRGRGGLLAPQVQAVAAWLVQLEPTRFSSLLAEDPAAFALSSVEMNDDQFRQILVRGLLGLAAQNQLFDVPPESLKGLTYPGLAEDLRVVILDESATFEARYLAVRLARMNDVHETCDSLTQLAMGSAEVIPLRNAAGHALLEFGHVDNITLLATLSEGSGPTEDPDDELLGLGLKAKLHLEQPVTAILGLLRRPSNVDLFGNYRSLLAIDLPATLLSPDLPLPQLLGAVSWANGEEGGERPRSARMDEFDKDRLLDAILQAALERLGEDGVTLAVAGLLTKRVRTNHGVWHDRSGGPPLPQLRTQDRRALLDAVSAQLESSREVFVLARSGLLSGEDFVWLTERAAIATDTTTQERWITWIRTVFDRGDPSHEQALTGLLGHCPAYREALAPLLQPLEDHQRLWEEEEEEDAGATPTDEEIRSDLLDCLDSSEADAFIGVCHFLRFTGGLRYAADNMPADIRTLPGWELLSTAEQDRVVESASRYLAECEANLDRYLGTDRVGWDAIAGTRAFALLFAIGRELELTESRWGFWAPAFVVWPFHDDPATSAALAELARRAPEALERATEKHIAGGASGSGAFDRILAVLGPPSMSWMLHLLDDSVGSADLRVRTFERIAEISEADGLQRLSALLADPQSFPGLPDLIASSLISIGAAAWGLVKEKLLADANLAQEAIKALSSREARPSLSEEQIGELWELTLREYPRNEDPEMRGVHAVGPREQVAIWRDRLIPALAALGTVEAVEVLQGLARRHPETWLWYHVEQAKSALRKGDWSPLGLQELTQALDDQRLILRNDADLLEVVTEAINDIQGLLVGATPEATLLWNHRSICDTTLVTGCLPKTEDEVSDYLRNRLAPAIPKSVVNREVQVERLATRGVGRRTDILVEVPSVGGVDRVLRVVIEVKGCWNKEVPTALQAQLVDTYLQGWPGAAGLYLIAWFDPAHGGKRGTWLGDVHRSSREALQPFLEQQARAATDAGGHVVRAVVLDCSMPR